MGIQSLNFPFVLYGKSFAYTYRPGRISHGVHSQMNCVNSNHRCAIATGSQSHNDVMLVCSVLPESWFIGFVVQSSSLWYPLVSLGITDWAAMACSFLIPATPPSFHWEAHNSGINCSIPNSNSYVSQPPCCCPLQSPKPRGGYRNLLQPGLLTKIMLKLLLWA